MARLTVAVVAITANSRDRKLVVQWHCVDSVLTDLVLLTFPNYEIFTGVWARRRLGHDRGAGPAEWPGQQLSRRAVCPL